MKRILKENDDSKVYYIIKEIMDMLTGICSCKIMSGHLCIEWEDGTVMGIVRTRYKDNIINYLHTLVQVYEEIATLREEGTCSEVTSNEYKAYNETTLKESEMTRVGDETYSETTCKDSETTHNGITHKEISRKVSETCNDRKCEGNESYKETFCTESKTYIEKSRENEIQVFKEDVWHLCYLQRLVLNYEDNAEKLKKHFIMNFHYLYTRLHHSSLCHVINDISFALHKYPHDKELKILLDVIDLSSHALNHSPEQFAIQLLCRLYGYQDLRSYTSDKETQSKNSQTNQCHIDSSSSLGVLLNTAGNLCRTLKPSRQCLVMPAHYCNISKEKQNCWQMKDLKIVFLQSEVYQFIGYSIEQEKIFFYNNNREMEKTIRFKGLQSVVFITQGKLLLECEHSLQLYDIELQKTTDILGVDIFATNHNGALIGLDLDMKCLRLINICTLQTTWTFQTNAIFYSVVVSKNGTRALCFMDNGHHSNQSEESSIQSVESFRDDQTVSPLEEEIIILNLKDFKQILSLSMPNDYFFGKVFALSEDGLYFIRVIEPTMDLLVWKLDNGTIEHKINTKACRIIKLLVSSRGGSIAFLSIDSTIRIFNLSDGSVRHVLTEPVQAIRGGYTDDQHCLCISDDGIIAVHSVKSNYQRSFVVVWNIITGQRLSALTTDFCGLSFQLSPQGNYLVSNFPVGLVTFNL